MADFEELDAYLAEDFQDDYWFDEAVAHAASLIGELSAEGWEALNAAWTSRGSAWQIRAAYVAPHGMPEWAGPLLLAMIRHGDAQVRLAALDSVRGLDLRRLGAGEREFLTEEAKRALRSTRGPVERVVLANLATLLASVPSEGSADS